MSTEKEKLLHHKYLEAKSSLQEEEELFSSTEAEGPLEPWKTYRENQKSIAPSNLTERISQKIDSQRTKTRTLYFGIPAIAATLALVITFYFQTRNQESMSTEEKQAVLEQVLQMFPEEEGPDESIIYEDDLIVIYYDNQ